MLVAQDLLKPLADASPSGPNLRYDPVYDRIKQARKEDPFHDPPIKADWAQIEKLATEVLAKRSKDLWVAAWLSEALLRRNGIPGLSTGLNLVQGLLETFWDDVHPQADEGDLGIRAAPLAWIGTYLDVPVRLAPLNALGHDYLGYRESQAVPTEQEADGDKEKRARRETALAEGRLDPESFESGFLATPNVWYRELATALDASVDRATTLEAFCDERFGEDAPGFHKLRDALEEFGRAARILLAHKLEQEPDAADSNRRAGGEAGSPVASDSEGDDGPGRERALPGNPAATGAAAGPEESSAHPAAITQLGDRAPAHAAAHVGSTAPAAATAQLGSAVSPAAPAQWESTRQAAATAYVGSSASPAAAPHVGSTASPVAAAQGTGVAPMEAGARWSEPTSRDEAAEPTSREEAAERIAAAARYLRGQAPTDPASYLVLRALRWGELRADGGTLDPRLLEAPPTELRSQLKGLLLDGRWADLLEAAERIMATSFGRGWLDLQRYVVTALERLGADYGSAADAVRGALRSLLRDLPDLVDATLMDDTATANRETLAWLQAQGLPGAGADAEEHVALGPASPAGQVPESPESADRILKRLGTSEPQRAIGILMGAAEREKSERSRFLRRADAARIMVETGHESVALPILHRMLEQIEQHRLEEWEAGETVAGTLGLLYRCMDGLGTDSKKREALYLRVCRLDPLQAMGVGAGRATHKSRATEEAGA